MKRSSSTSSSEKRRVALRVTAFLLPLLLLLYGASLLAKATNRLTDQTWRVQDDMVEEFYASPENSYNLLFLGTSHSMCSFDPSVFDGLSGYDIDCYNLGGSSTLPDASYYLLRDALDRNRGVKLVVMDLFYLLMAKDYDGAAAALIWRPMPPTRSKLEMFFDDFNEAERDKLIRTWVNPFYRLKNTAVYNADVALGLEERKTDKTGVYMCKGFYTFPDKVFNPKDYVDEFKKNPETYLGVSDRQKEYVKKIAALCRERGVTLVFVSTPLSPTYRSLLTYLDQPMAELAALAKVCGAEMLEYNGEAFASTGVADGDYADRHHFNREGARRFSTFFAKELANRGYLVPYETK